MHFVMVHLPSLPAILCVGQGRNAAGFVVSGSEHERQVSPLHWGVSKLTSPRMETEFKEGNRGNACGIWTMLAFFAQLGQL